MKPLWNISFIALSLVLVYPLEKEATLPLKYGAVAAASPEATKTGMDIMRKGGNAVDAAIAISFVLGVTEPAMSGIGGGTQVIIYIPGQNKPFSIDGSTLSPALTPTFISKDSLYPHQRASIPSTMKMMGFLYEHYASGKISWASLLQPAIKYAQEGFVMGPFREKIYNRYLENLEQRKPETAQWLQDSLTGIIRQPILARTLQILASSGAEAFYQGEIAKMIEADMIQNQGWIRKADLLSFPSPSLVESVHFRYKGYDIYTQPEPCGGWIVKEILEKLATLEKEHPDQYLANLINAIHLGHTYRNERSVLNSQLNENGETTHYSVMDNQGMTLAVTASINAYYGIRHAHPELGFLYNSYMDDFSYEDSNSVYAIGPGKKAYSSMAPTLVMKNGKVVMAIGSPGSARIISTVAQLVERYASSRNSTEELVHIPRIHVNGSKLYLEDSTVVNLLPSETIRRFKLSFPSTYLQHNQLNAYFGGVHMIVQTNDGIQAFADPRRDGLAIFE